MGYHKLISLFVVCFSNCSPVSCKMLQGKELAATCSISHVAPADVEHSWNPLCILNIEWSLKDQWKFRIRAFWVFRLFLYCTCFLSIAKFCHDWFLWGRATIATPTMMRKSWNLGTYGNIIYTNLSHPGNTFRHLFWILWVWCYPSLSTTSLHGVYPIRWPGVAWFQ